MVLDEDEQPQAVFWAHRNSEWVESGRSLESSESYSGPELRQSLHRLRRWRPKYDQLLGMCRSDTTVLEAS